MLWSDEVAPGFPAARGRCVAAPVRARPGKPRPGDHRQSKLDQASWPLCQRSNRGRLCLWFATRTSLAIIFRHEQGCARNDSELRADCVLLAAVCFPPLMVAADDGMRTTHVSVPHPMCHAVCLWSACRSEAYLYSLRATQPPVPQTCQHLPAIHGSPPGCLQAALHHTVCHFGMAASPSRHQARMYAQHHAPTRTTIAHAACTTLLLALHLRIALSCPATLAIAHVPVSVGP